MSLTTGHPSTAAIAGHPLHPMVVPLPIASGLLAFVSDLGAVRSGLTMYVRASQWLLGICVVSGLVAAPAGAIDAVTIKAARTSPQTWAHAGGNVAVLGIAAFEWLRRWRGPLTPERVWPSATGLMVSILLVTGWLGGELAYRKGIGVSLTRPGTDGEGSIERDGSRPAGTDGHPATDLGIEDLVANGALPAEGRRDLSRV